MFENAVFIKPNITFIKEQSAPVPFFRKKFILKNKPVKAVLHVAALGCGYFYINGKPVSDNLFTAPVSDYRKTIWYTSYDVTDLLGEGENVLAAECGNGFYNESVTNIWDFHIAEWRDNPKMIAQLDVDGKTALVSDASFRFTTDAATIYNELRMGEYYDSQLYLQGWNDLDFDDSGWQYAVTDDAPPSGVYRLCDCEPIRECEVIEPVSIRKTADGVYLYDFGKNMSGYIRIRVNQPAGDQLTLHYWECSDEDGNIRITPQEFNFYPEDSHMAQIDMFTCCGKEFEWSPRFTYHGFRYVQISGLRAPCEAKALFVHQDVKRRSDFCCSNDTLNHLFACGIQSTWSNMFYMPTDCPTREKLGWCNDAQSSAEQFMTNFAAEHFFGKWIRDIYDSMDKNGGLPGIVPTGGWGYEWGNGPVSEGILFEVPYRVWRHTGNTKIMTDSIPYFMRNLAYLDAKEVNGELNFGLNDWAAYGSGAVSASFVNAALRINFYTITILAKELAGEDASALYQKKLELVKRFREKYLLPDGRCSVNKQTAVAMIIVMELSEDLQPLKEQLKQLVEDAQFHHDCGMVGIRYIFDALDQCGLQEYAYRIVTARGKPSYVEWMNDGATTLYEYWDMEHSKNHHMYSNVISWLIKTPLGLVDTYEKIVVNPYYFKDLSFVRGSIEDVKVCWQRNECGICLEIDVPDGINVEYCGRLLEVGSHKYHIENE